MGDRRIELRTPTVSMLSRTSWLVPLTLEPLVSGTSGVGWRGWRWSVSVAAWPPRGPGECRRSRACSPPRGHALLGTPAQRLVPGCTLPTMRSPPPQMTSCATAKRCDPEATSTRIHPPMKAPGCASAIHGLPSCRNDTDPRAASAHVPDEAGLPALATRRSVRSIDVVISDRVPRIWVVRASARGAIPCRTRDVERRVTCC